MRRDESFECRALADAHCSRHQRALRILIRNRTFGDLDFNEHSVHTSPGCKMDMHITFCNLVQYCAGHLMQNLHADFACAPNANFV